MEQKEGESGWGHLKFIKNLPLYKIKEVNQNLLFYKFYQVDVFMTLRETTH